jgi:hypothetical protein
MAGRRQAGHRPGRTSSLIVSRRSMEPSCFAALHLRASEENEMLNDDLNRNAESRELRPHRSYWNGRRYGCAHCWNCSRCTFVMWAPNGPRVANAPGTTVGSSTTRPSAADDTEHFSGSNRAGRTFHYPVTKQPLEANSSSGFSMTILVRPTAS